MSDKFEVVPYETGWAVSYRGKFVTGKLDTRETAISTADAMNKYIGKDKTYFETTRLGTLISLFKKKK